jgi:hypothetical protein
MEGESLYNITIQWRTKVKRKPTRKTLWNVEGRKELRGQFLF